MTWCALRMKERSIFFPSALLIFFLERAELDAVVLKCKYVQRRDFLRFFFVLFVFYYCDINCFVTVCEQNFYFF
jgi:hypothetical protein